jgi:hypothetical protein
MRIIDYITNPLIFLLIKTPQIIQNDHYFDIPDPQESPQQVCEKNIFEVIKKFYEPTFLAFDCNVQNVHALFKPWPKQPEYLRIEGSKVKIYNVNYETTNRYPEKTSPFPQNVLASGILGKLWCESWIILGEDMKIKFIREDPRKNMGGYGEAPQGIKKNN